MSDDFKSEMKKSSDLDMQNQSFSPTGRLYK